MNERIGTAAHWGAYEGVRSGDGVSGLRPVGSDPDPPSISAGLADVRDPRARVPRPLVREGYLAHGPDSREERGRERYVPVSWDRALDLAAEALQATRERLGADGVFGGSYGWASAGRFHHPQSQLRRFLNLTGGCVSAINTYSSAAAEVAVGRFLGSSAMIDAGHDWPTIRDNTELLLCFGGLPLKNAAIDAGSTGPHVDARGLNDCLEAGVEVVSVSPLRHVHDDRADIRWLAPRPNTDVALMLGLAHWLIENDRIDRDFLARCCVGADRTIAYVSGETDGVPKTPAWAARIADLDEADIAGLARRMSEKRTLIAVAWALQRADRGEQPFWMACALAALLGGIGRPGEGLGYGLGTFNNYGAGRTPFRKAAFPRLDPAGRRVIPVSRVADMLLSPGATVPYDGRRIAFPEIGLVWWAGGNPFHHHQDLHRLARAFRRPDTVIVNDSVFQPTCRLADIVLPATAFLERNDWAASAHGGFFSPMHKLAEPFGEARNDHDVFAAMADRFGKREAFDEGLDEMGWIRRMWNDTRDNARRAGRDLPDFETFWSGGAVSIPVRNATSAKLARLREDPEAHPLDTPSGRIELFSETVAGFGHDDCPGHPVWREPEEWLGAGEAGRHPLHLLSDQPAGRLHGQLDPGGASRATKVRGREPCLIHPDDAAARGIADGDILRVFNGRGACLAGAVVTGRIRRGAVNIATGSWFDCAAPGDPRSLERHGNPNVLTRDAGCSSLSQGPSCNSTLVECEKFEGDPPPVEAYDIPLRLGS